MKDVLIEELIRFLEIYKGKKLTIEQVLEELNGVGLIDLRDRFLKAHNNPLKASKAG